MRRIWFLTQCRGGKISQIFCFFLYDLPVVLRVLLASQNVKLDKVKSKLLLTFSGLFLSVSEVEVKFLGPLG